MGGTTIRNDSASAISRDVQGGKTMITQAIRWVTSTNFSDLECILQ